MAGFSLDVADPTDFENAELRTLDSSLRCPMCKEFFEGPVLISQCGHTFCSLCIRGYLPSKSECPTCRHATSESSLIRNPTLEDAVFAYQSSRPVVLSSVRENAQYRARSLKRKGKPSVDVDGPPKKRKRSHRSSVASGESSSSEDEIQLAGPSTSRSPHLKSRPHKDTLNDNETDIEQVDPLVACPICHFKLPHSRVNAHIDRGCNETPKKGDASAWGKLFSAKSGGKSGESTKKAQSTAGAAPEEAQVREPIPKVTWNLMKDKGIREMLVEYDLPTDGDKKTLQARFDKWIALYNASLDTSRPKSLSRLRRDLKEWERTQEQDVMAKKTREKKIKDTAAYMASNQDQFAVLTAQVKARRSTVDKKDACEPGPTLDTTSPSLPVSVPSDTRRSPLVAKPSKFFGKTPSPSMISETQGDIIQISDD